MKQVEGDVMIQVWDGPCTTLVLRISEGGSFRHRSFPLKRRLPSLRGRYVRFTGDGFVNDLGPSFYCIQVHAEIQRLLDSGSPPLPLGFAPNRVLGLRPKWGPHGWSDLMKKLALTASIGAERRVNMANSQALAASIKELTAYADPESDVIVIVRGGGDSVAAFDHADVAKALCQAARTVPTILAVGHSADTLRVGRLLHPDLVMDVPSDAGRYIAALHGIVSEPSPARAVIQLASVGQHGAPPGHAFECDEPPVFERPREPSAQDPSGSRVALNVHATVVHPVIERVVHFEAVPSLPPPSWWQATSNAPQRRLAVLGAFCLLGVLLAVGARLLATPSAPTQAAAKKSTPPASTRVGATLKPSAPASLAPRPHPVRTARPPVRRPQAAANAVVQPRTPSPRGATPTVSPEGRVILPAPPPSVRIQESSLLRRQLD